MALSGKHSKSVFVFVNFDVVDVLVVDDVDAERDGVFLLRLSVTDAVVLVVVIVVSCCPL